VRTLESAESAHMESKDTLEVMRNLKLGLLNGAKNYKFANFKRMENGKKSSKKVDPIKIINQFRVKEGEPKGAAAVRNQDGGALKVVYSTVYSSGPMFTPAH
jgi:hypothetical protein